MIAHAMETGYGVGTLETNLDIPTVTEIPPATGPHQKFNKVGRILLHDANARKYFLIVTNNEGTPHALHLTLDDLPSPLSSLAVTVPHDNRKLMLHPRKGGGYSLQDQLSGYTVTIYLLS